MSDLCSFVHASFSRLTCFNLRSLDEGVLRISPIVRVAGENCFFVELSDVTVMGCGIDKPDCLGGVPIVSKRGNAAKRVAANADRTDSCLCSCQQGLQMILRIREASRSFRKSQDRVLKIAFRRPRKNRRYVCSSGKQNNQWKSTTWVGRN